MPKAMDHIRSPQDVVLSKHVEAAEYKRSTGLEGFVCKGLAG